MGKDGNEENILDYEFNKIAGNVLKEKRISKNISLDLLSNKINNLVSKQAISRYENGQARIKNNVFLKICYALNCEPADIFTEIHKKYIEHIDNNIQDIMKRIKDNK